MSFIQLWFSSCLNVLNRKNHTYIMDCLSIIFGNDGNYFGVTGDSSRVYFGTDTRLQTLLLGCILAFVWNPFGLKRQNIKCPT